MSGRVKVERSQGAQSKFRGVREESERRSSQGPKKSDVSGQSLMESDGPVKV